MNFLLWILPFVVLALSYFTFRANILKGARYKLYVLILFIAFVLDLTQLSFTNDIVDTVIYLLITFVIADIGWNILKMRKVALRTIFLIIGIAAFSWSYLGWIIQGPAKNSLYWSQKIIANYTNHKNRPYVLKENFDFSFTEKIRNLSLYKIKKVPFLEECVREYNLPEGYENADLKFGWSNTVNGVRLDIIDGKDTIWTLGEGF